MSFRAEIGGGCRSGQVFITTYFGAGVGRKDGRQYPSLELYIIYYFRRRPMLST